MSTILYSSLVLQTFRPVTKALYLLRRSYHDMLLRFSPGDWVRLGQLGVLANTEGLILKIEENQNAALSLFLQPAMFQVEWHGCYLYQFSVYPPQIDYVLTLLLATSFEGVVLTQTLHDLYQNFVLITACSEGILPS